MPRHLLRAVFLVALFAGTLGVAAPALAVDTPFSVRYADTLRGSINAVGNQLLTCPVAAANCANARARTGAAGTMNNNYNMEYVDVDGDGTTVNSSTATLALPAGATVTWAGLYWGADTSAGAGGSAAPNAANRGTVKFKVGAGAYQNVTAAGADVLTSTGVATRYRAFANVTSLVSGAATYGVADVQTGRGDDRWAGWSLLVAYRDSAQNVHRVSVYDGLGTVSNGVPFSTTITPFYTPASGTVDTRVGMLAFEGDAGIAVGESQTFNGSSLVDAENPVDNPLNSTFSINGAAFTAKNPNYPNLQGTDIDVSDRTGLLGNHQSSAVLSYASGQDLFVPSALWLVSDEGPPSNTAGPTVGGVARDGSTLTANPGTWGGTPTLTYQYQWQRCDAAGANCVNIPGETGSTYTLTPADVGSTIRVLVTAVNDAGSSAPSASAPSATITQLAPSNVTLPQLSGTQQDGQTLTTTIGGWNGTAPLGYDVQWQRCDALGANCTDIPAATAWSYVLGSADIGSTVRSEVTATNDAGFATAVSAPTTTVDPAPPVNTTVPAVSGAVRDGQTLTADDGDWTGTDPLSYAYQWERCDAGGANCTDVGGATSATYVLTGTDIGHAMRVEVTATNVAGNAAANSSPTAAVIADPPANTAVPTLTGTATEGSTLTLDNGTWTGTSPLAYDVVWQRCDGAGANCVAIPGESGSTYTLTTDDLDATVRALVTASNIAGVAAVASAPTAVVAMNPPANTVLPLVSGNRVDGETLSADTGTWTGTQPLLHTYQWERCDGLGANCTDIGGATSVTYVLTGADIGHVVRVEVTAANDAGTASAESIPGGPVAPAPPVNVTVPTTSGTTTSGQVLTAGDGSWTGSAPMTATYRWERCDTAGANCADIAGATAGTYTLEDADAGHTARVAVTYTNTAGTDTARSAPTAVIDGIAPANTVAPLLSGTARDGETLTLDDGDWTGTPAIAYTYQWQRCSDLGTACVDITGATGLTYDLQSADIDGTVRAVVTATNTYGDDSAATVPSAVVAAAPPALTIAPAVIGTALDGETVTADPGVWSGTAPVSYVYQWLRCDLDGTNCTDIAGATDDEYTLTSADADHGIRVEVTATNAAGSATEVSPVAAVDAAAPQNTALPTVSGTYTDGHTLTAGDGVWAGTTPTFEYQWLRCDEDGTNCQLIPGATGSTYTLTPDDIDHQVIVNVEATNSAGTAQATSVPPAAAVAADPPQSTTPPAVTGVLEDGATLAAGTGGWTGTEPLVFTYQWQRCDAGGATCEDIDGATGTTYTLTADDVDGTVRVIVTATNDAGADTSTSPATGTVAPSAPVSTTPPAVTGSSVDGQTLTADPGSFSGTGPLVFTYQWQRCEADGSLCADIPGATGSTYDLVSADVGGAIAVVVTATNDADSATASSPATTEVQALAPANVSAPTISGDPLDGETLTADPGIWTGTTPVTYTYQWQRCEEDGTGCVAILGAVDPTYTLVPSDIDHVLTVVVTATNAGGSVPSASAPTVTAEAAPPANTVVPTVSGTPEDGETLTADPGTWSGTAPVVYTYEWQRCDADGTDCVVIAGATGSTYVLAPLDVGHAIVVEVTGTNAAGTDSATSVPSSSVAVDPPATAGTPAATGTPVDGQTLTAEPGTWTGTGPIEFTYQWQRCDSVGALCVDIPGATDPTYTLGTDDLGSTVRVVVTGDNGEQTDVPSTAVGPIAALPPASTSVPTVSGTVADGHTLTAGDGAWDGSLPLTFTYQWQRCDSAGAGCVDVPGADEATYDLTAADVGHTIRVEVTAANSAGDDTAVSAPTVQTLPAPPVNTTQPPAPTGTGVDGGSLTADPGVWTGDGPITYSYQWQRCDVDGTGCVEIGGATDETYSPVPADVGHAVVVEVTATNAGGSTTEASAPTATPILANPPLNTIAPTIAGIPADGETLTAGHGTWSGTPTITYEYQWRRCADDGTACVDIAGATDDTYSPTGADAGHAIVVVVTASNAGGSAAEASEPTDPVTAEPPVNTVPPSVTGTPADGGTLTADPGTWTGTLPIDYTYQWQRCNTDGTGCTDIAGATGETYSPTAADVGHPIVVVVTATNPGDSSTVASAPSAATLPAPPINTTPPPAPTGTGVDGGTLTAAPGTWTGDGTITYTYQWQRCADDGTACVDIDGATDETYSPVPADVGHAVVVEVTATNAGGSTTEASAPTAAPIAAAPPVNTVPASIEGDAADGETLTADPGTWTGTPTIDYDYQWQRCDGDGTNCVDIADATGETYTPGPGDIDHAITVVVTATNAGGSVTGPVAEPTDPVVASPPADTTPPAITGDADVGETLTAGTGTWTGTAPVTFEYQWQRCDADGTDCVDITGATGEAYEVGEDDRGHTVVVVVTAENTAGNHSSTSAPTAVVPAPPANTVAPTISGDHEVGETLTADPGTWTGTGTLVYTYQWQRCDSTGDICEVISGATDDTYTLTGADVGHTITVIVTATNDVAAADADAQPTAAVQPVAEPTPTPTPTPTPNARPVTRPQPVPDTLPAAPGSDPLFGDLGSVPGSLVSDASCQQLAGNAKYRRLKLRGIGTVRVRAYTAGPATKLTPILVTTQISHGKAKRVKVRYTLDGRKLRAGRKSSYKAAITPTRLQRIGVHKLKAMVTAKGKRKRAKPILLKLKTVSCRTLFTAQRWRTTAGAGLRLRIDARTALDRLAFKVPAALLPRQTAKRRTVGFMRVFVAGQSLRKRYALKLVKKGRGKYLLKTPGKPVVRYVRGGLEVRGLPARSAVAELTIYRVTKRDGATKRKRYRLKAKVIRPGARALSLSVRPRAPR